MQTATIPNLYVFPLGPVPLITPFESMLMLVRLSLSSSSYVISGDSLASSVATGSLIGLRLAKVILSQSPVVSMPSVISAVPIAALSGTKP